MPWSRVLKKLIVTQLERNFLPFMGLKGSSSSSQKPSTGTYPEPSHLKSLFL